ncbi:heavy metal translocating P-type ATPase [Aquabacterium sp.]|uniref:heavy metal translocating P-type ATPase n=1 Tax=Aquabacterium sp. TaxID=1872578 RepID=UPI002E30A53D|nr:heavy metal translocating P-type ATPase [Aquabacterium sp.]HEX5312329.1 heavy metal translocating P-type ATPase [Aquabacterium sp.]
MSTPTRRLINIPIRVEAAAPRPAPTHAHPHHHEHAAHEEASASCCSHDDCCAPGDLTAPVSVANSQAAPEGADRIRFRIDKMDCPTEERLIRNRLEPMAGVVRLDFNLIARELTVFHQLKDTSTLAAALTELDMAPTLLEVGQKAAPLPQAVPLHMKLQLALAGLAALAAEVLDWREAPLWAIALAASLAVALSGGPTLKKGWIALRHLTLNIYFLMTLAVLGAVLIGKWSEAAMVIFLFAVAEAIEAVSLEHARKAIQSLSALAPDTANIWRQGHWQSVPLDGVAEGERMMVRAGERIGLDATVLKGPAALNEAPITGESMPVDKHTGDPLFAGSIVVDGVVEAQVTATAGHSTLARIAAAIQEAQAQRAPTQRFVDQFARYYTPSVVVLAVLVALLGPWLAGGGALHWVYQALVMLVIACPCALVVSTPVTVVSGLANAARQGILIKGGVHLEQGRLIKAVALDKTGTLTAGRPTLTDVITLQRYNAQNALRIAASLDQHSSHPIAQALVAAWRERDPHGALAPVEHFDVLAGRGVKGRLLDQHWQLGNHRLVEELGLCSPELEARLETLEIQGKTAFVLLDEQGAVAILAMADTLRAESRQAIEALDALNVKAVMLTGDNQATAEHIAKQAGITEVRGNMLPADKLDAINQLVAAHGAVGMVGDGVNDAPALARATVGIAMGAAGTATALETADVAIMDDDPRKVAQFIRLSQATSRVLKQNIALALGIKAVFLALALGNHATLWMAVFADMGASLLVVFNGLRLLRLKA